MYSEKEARELVIKAGLELIEKKLIARTWGNISARISDEEFIITPSGRAYEDLKPQDLVKVKIADSSYEGEIKPSSEKTMHAYAYALRKDCNFIVHTHQPYASALSVEGIDFDYAPTAKYGLPSTKKLAKNVAKAIENNPKSNTFLMERHGVITLGKDYKEAFDLADKLEVKAKQEYDKNHVDKKVKKVSKPYLDDYAQMFGFNGKAFDADSLAQTLVKEKNALAYNYAKKAKPMHLFDVLLQRLVYKMKYSKLQHKK